MHQTRTTRGEGSAILTEPDGPSRVPRSRAGLPDDIAIPQSLSTIRTKIRTLVSIAAAHDSSLPTADLMLLLPLGAFASTESLVSFLSSDPIFEEELTVTGDEIVFKGCEKLVHGQGDQIRLTARRVSLARSFSGRLSKFCPWLRLVAISGSASYGRSRAADDVDFFIVTRENRLWITLLFAMLFAKGLRVKDPSLPVLCLNRMVEEPHSEAAFRATREPLFAREALNLRVLVGDAYYRRLLESASWMEQIFPLLYRRALETVAHDDDGPEVRQTSFWSIANWIAFVGLAPYLVLAGFWRNARLKETGNFDARFRTVVRRKFFAYESKKYDLLREAYREAF
jgi:hypothetical protein